LILVINLWIFTHLMNYQYNIYIVFTNHEKVILSNMTKKNKADKSIKIKT